jgi:hypothetical protein
MAEESAETNDAVITITLTKNEQVAILSSIRFLQFFLQKAPGVMRNMKEVQVIDKDAIPSLLEKISKATGHGGKFDPQMNFKR